MKQVATQQTAFRLPVPLLKRLDRRAESLRAEHPGMKVTRADVVRVLLTKALDDVDAEVASRQNDDSGYRKR